MPRPVKVAVLAISGLIILLIVLAVVLTSFVDANQYKGRLEATASAAFGVDVTIEGRLGIAVAPRLFVTMQNLHLRNRGEDIAFAEEARFGIDFFHLLLHRQLRLTSLTLKHANVNIVRSSEGLYNFDDDDSRTEPLPPLEVASVSVVDGAIHYTNAQSGVGFDASACAGGMHRLVLVAGKRSEFVKNLSFTADLACGEFGKNDVTVSDFKLSVKAKGGIFDLDPITMPLFGAKGLGDMHADLSGEVPQYTVRYSLPQFRIEEFFRTLSPHNVAEGSMDFSAALSMHGKTVSELKPTLQGVISLSGTDLTLDGHDLDEEFARFESSQNFNLVDVAALFLVGPLGVVVTKGYNFASLLQGSEGSSEIRTLVSDWTVENGVAQAQDVAMATNKNRVAARGGLDFVNGQFVDVTVALIDDKGCAKAHQMIHGAFKEPAVDKVNVLRSLAGPALELLKKGRSIFPGGECEVFYAGSVPPPEA